MASHDFFVMIKPDGVRRGLVGEIVSRFEKKNFSLLAMKMLDPSPITTSLIMAHYASHNTMHYYQSTVDFICSGPIVVMRWHGNIQVARCITGHTLPWEAQLGSIRGDYASSFPENLIHCSHSSVDATKELELWSGVV
jgi:nucleoside-diphosphate kinase